MITLSRKQQMTYQYLCIIALVIIVGYVFLSIDISRSLSFFKSNEFIGVALSLFSIGIVWKVLSGTSHRFPLTIIIRQRHVHVESAKTRFGFVFPLIGYGIALAFVVNMIVLIFFAFRNGTGKVVVDFNHFSEMHAEILIFVACFVVCFIGFFFAYQNMKTMLKK
jgi:hypothetical protein